VDARVGEVAPVTTTVGNVPVVFAALSYGSLTLTPTPTPGLIDINLEIRSPGAGDALVSCRG
jgi:hypothetical protein